MLMDVGMWHIGHDMQTGDHQNDIVQQAKWRNFNAFVNRLRKANILRTGWYNVSIGLEPGEETNRPFAHDYPLELKINIATDLLLIAGDRLIERTQDLKQYMEIHGLGPYIENRDIWTGPDGCVCIERWEFWARRLRNIARDEKTFGTDTRKQAAEAEDWILSRIKCAVDQLD